MAKTTENLGPCVECERQISFVKNWLKQFDARDPRPAVRTCDRCGEPSCQECFEALHQTGRCGT